MCLRNSHIFTSTLTTCGVFVFFIFRKWWSDRKNHEKNPLLQQTNQMTERQVKQYLSPNHSFELGKQAHQEHYIYL